MHGLESLARKDPLFQFETLVVCGAKVVDYKGHEVVKQDVVFAVGLQHYLLEHDPQDQLEMIEVGWGNVHRPGHPLYEFGERDLGLECPTEGSKV